MRFRLLFLVFNVVIIVSFVLIFLMPAFVLGWEYTRVFWSTNWPIGAVFVVVLIGLNVYFLSNWKVFTLLEQEAWEEVRAHLESQLFDRNRASAQGIRILINSYVVTGSLERMDRLAALLKEKHPRLAARLALELALPRLLSGNGATMVEELGATSQVPGTRRPLWIHWCHAVALMMASRLEDAKQALIVVTREARDPLLKLLSASMLQPYGKGDEETRAFVASAKAELTANWSREKIGREVDRHRQNLHVLLLSSQLEKASDWAFGAGEA